MYVGVDIGGTKVLAVALAENGTQPLAEARVPMPGRLAHDRELEDAVDEAVRRLAPGGDVAAVQGVGIASAGMIDADGEKVRFSAHLPWRDAPVRERFATRWNVPVALDNDANCAAYAEVVAGAARGEQSALLVTVGTGIGGAVILEDRVVRGAHGMAGEFGHMQVVPDGLPCECGLRGCWEQYCSGRALERAIRLTLGAHRDGPEVARAAAEGDLAAVRAFAMIGDWLGVGVAGLIGAFDPAVVVIGGGVSSAGDLLLEPARAALRSAIQAPDHRALPPIVRAAYGSEASAVGAALMVHHR